MKVKAATFTTSGELMRNKESTLPGLIMSVYCIESNHTYE